MAAVKVETRAGATSRAERIVGLAVPSIGDILFISLFFGVLFGLQGRVLGYDGDSAWNLRIGTHVLDHGLPRAEFMLSTTYGHPTIYWEWLSQVIYALGLRLGGLNGVVTVAAALVAATGVSLFAILRRRGVPLLAAVGLALLGIGLTSITWTARAQLFSLLFTVWWTEWIWRYWRDGNPRRLWAFPLAMAVWVNLHGGFLGGLILLGTAAAVAWLFHQRRGQANPRHLTLALAGSLAATLVNPWGIGLDLHILAFFANPLIARYTQEYQSPDFHSLSALLFLALALLLAGLWIWRGRGGVGAVADGPEPLAVAQAGVWTALACYSVRFLPLWSLNVTPILADALLVWWRAQRSTGEQALTTGAPILTRAARSARSAAEGAGGLSRRLAGTDSLVGKGIWSALAILCVLVLLRGGGALPGSSTRLLDARYDAHVFPVQAAQRLHELGLPPGRGFTTFDWGGYLDYALPEYHVYIDSR
ncbi:MAG TPA: hypothetical protein VGS80_18370, partial [Ktedonobacterales bacterium]|nr:hypothetical protein [Ktedonobacterales bacterium]